jgi:hypothetical protein
MMTTRSAVTSSMDQLRQTYDLADAFCRHNPFNFLNFVKFLNKKVQVLQEKTVE